jgi:hypothetical protein
MKHEEGTRNLREKIQGGGEKQTKTKWRSSDAFAVFSLVSFRQGVVSRDIHSAESRQKKSELHSRKNLRLSQKL